MSSAFEKLKKSRKSIYDKIKEETNKTNDYNSTDTRFWQPTVDAAGNGYAVIRFLPPPQDEDLPWVRLFTHGFQGSGGWYINNSLTTIGEKDPVGELNSELWNNGTEEGKEQARKQKRRLSYISNIYVISDKANPQNEGKVFLYKYGKKIHDKINDLMNPEFEDEKPINPFDLWDGANFKLKIRNVEGYRNYDKSEFDNVSPLNEDDDELEKIFLMEYSLNEFLDQKNFKSYAELETQLKRVLGNKMPSTKRAEELDMNEEIAEPKQFKSEDNDVDDSMEFFRKLGEKDDVDDEIPF